MAEQLKEQNQVKTFSEQVRDVISRFPTEKEKAEPREWLKNYLLWSHSLMRASVPLMQIAAANIPDSDLRSYYIKHSREEKDHDLWVLDDLESIGVSKQESLMLKPSQGMAELVGSQYYWIFHWHPVCLLGYIGVIEGNPPQKAGLDKLKEMTGFGDEAFRTLYKHSDLDVKHKADLDDVLNSLPLSDLQKEWVLSNAEYTARKLKEIRYR